LLADDTRRLNYRDGQYLGVADFVAEQQYHRDMRRRLNLTQDSWGIYVGLELSEQPREGSTTAVDVFITPGIAIDGFGREIVNFAPYRLEPALFARFTVEQWLEVWIAFATEQTDLPRFGYELCDDPDLRYRTRETFKVEIGPRSTPLDPIVVAGTPTPPTAASLPPDLSVPFQALPEDEERARWLVQLGSVHWDGTSGFLESEPGDEAVRTRGRVYGGAIASHTYAIDNTWELISRLRGERVEGCVRGTLTVEDLIVGRGQGIELDGGALTLMTPAGVDNGNPLSLSRQDRTDGGADVRVTIGGASAGKNHLVVASDRDRVTVSDAGTLALLGGQLTIQHAPSGDADWGVKAGGETLQFVEPDDGNRVVFEVLDVGDDLSNPVLRLHGEPTATLSAEQLIDLTNGGETLLHTHRDATTLLKGMVEIALPGEVASAGESGARLVVPANDPRLLTQAQKDDLTDGDLTTLHRHPNGILNNVRVLGLSAHGSHDIFGGHPQVDIQDVDLGSQKRVVALAFLRRITPDGTVDEYDDFHVVMNIDGGATSYAAYTGSAQRIRFSLTSGDDARADAVGVVFFEDL
jgi:hypothetical protein